LRRQSIDDSSGYDRVCNVRHLDRDSC
jgi:hypothetical protein